MVEMERFADITEIRIGSPVFVQEIRIGIRVKDKDSVERRRCQRWRHKCWLEWASVVTDRSVTQMTDPGQMGYNGQSKWNPKISEVSRVSRLRLLEVIGHVYGGKFWRYMISFHSTKM